MLSDLRGTLAGAMGFENGKLAKAVFEARSGNLQIVNVVHYDLVGNALDPAASLQALATRLTTDCMGPFKALFDLNWEIQPIVVTQEKDPLNPDAVRTGATGGAGGTGTRTGVSGDKLPLFCSRVVTLKTAKIGRSFRGRMFVSGAMFESDSLSNQWVAPSAGNFAFLADAFVNSFPLAPDLTVGPSTDSAKWCVYSKTRRARDQDDYANAITTKVPRPDIHSLRSRAFYN